MSHEITLPVGASAEPDTCGSCKFFKRKDPDYSTSQGFCYFQFPKKAAQQMDIRSVDPKQRDRDFSGNEDQIKDTDRCDLYRFSGKVYIVQRRIPSERTG